MVTPEDVERLVLAHERVREALDKKSPRRAAKILCEEFKWLLEAKGSFWADVKNAAETLSQHRAKEKDVLNSIAWFIEQEEQIFKDLGIDSARSGPVIANVYAAQKFAQVADEDLTPGSLKLLEEQLAHATKLVCAQSKGRIRQGVDWVFSWKGATILGGAAIVGANVAIMIAPHHAPVSWVSVKAGAKVMRGELEGLIDLLG